MKDGIVIAEALNGQVRIHAACTTEMVEEARIHHHCMPTSAAALGRVMSVSAIMASDLKDPQAKITSVFNGHGPAGTLLAQADGAGNVRGFIGDPNLYLVREDGHLAVGQAIGTDGTLTVTKDLGLKEPFTGVSKIQSGEVGDDFAYYFAISEQTPSVVGVGVLVKPDGSIRSAGGFIYQLLPNASEEAVEFCEACAKKQKPVSDLIDECESLEEMIRLYFPDAKILDTREVRWHCDCSKERFHAGLLTLRDTDLEEMIQEDEGCECVCQYCSTPYTFSKEELQEILEEKHVEDRKR